MNDILAEVGAFLVWLPERAWALVAGSDREWQLLGAAGLCLPLLCLVVCGRLAATADHRALRRQYRKLAKAGVADWELPCRLLTTREGWDELPDEFLMELAARLMERDSVIDFILLVEGDDFERDQFVRLTGYDPDAAMRGLSVLLTDHAVGLKAQAALGVLGLAIQIDPENHLALIDLATAHYAAKRFAEALPLLDQAITLGQQAKAGLPEATRGAAAQRGPAPGFTAQTLHGVLKLAGEMYDDCVERVGPEPA